jgi:hypothetical protein
MVSYYTYIELFLEDIHKSISLSEFAKHFKKPHQTVKVHLKNLVSEKILLIEKRERFLFYRLNLENPLTYEYITMCEKERMFVFLKKELFNRLYLALIPFNSPMLIFGSATTESKYNDVDLLVLSKNNAIRDIVKKFESTYSVKIHLIPAQENDLTKTFIKEVQKKHIILNNHEHFVKLIFS